jgi:propionyl-CoA synthetase
MPSALTDDAARLKLEGAIMKVVDEQLGAVARPARVRFVTVLPKTRSGKLLRRAIQAVCEGPRRRATSPPSRIRRRCSRYEPA